MEAEKSAPGRRASVPGRATGAWHELRWRARDLVRRAWHGFVYGPPLAAAGTVLVLGGLAGAVTGSTLAHPDFWQGALVSGGFCAAGAVLIALARLWGWRR